MIGLTEKIQKALDDGNSAVFLVFQKPFDTGNQKIYKQKGQLWFKTYFWMFKSKQNFIKFRQNRTYSF